MISCMPKSKKPEPQTDKNAENKVNRKGFNLNVWIDTELSVAFRDHCRKARRTQTAVTEMALEALLRSEGEWPIDEVEE